jgi:nicotinate-nucleotide adenylyltransferase
MYKKTLCLGGSFNPVHHGHLICARRVAEIAGFERVLLIPGRQPPHKPNQPDLADAPHRLQMSRLAAETDKTRARAGVIFEVSEIELARSGPSYTIDTVRELRNSGWDQVNWLIGADMLNLLPKWHEAAALLREVNFVITRRPGVLIDWNSLPVDFAVLQNKMVDAPLIEISSTQIRQRVRAGLSIDYLTPPAVVDYIRMHQLYRA